MSTSILLDLQNWDYVVDASGNWAICDEPYSTAQDVACALRCFIGDIWYEQTQGIPYLGVILGKLPPLSFLKQTFESAALTVPSVAKAQCFISSFTNRALAGQVLLTLKNGQTTGVGFNATANPFLLGTSILGTGDAL